MYHIKEDLRAEKSSELLYQGVMECLKTKDFDKVSISDITKISTVSRATFYRNFDQVIDILYWKCDRMFHELLTSYVGHNPDLKQAESLIRYVFSYWMKHTEILEVLIEQNRIDIIYNSFLSNAEIVMNYIYENSSLSKLNYEYFMASRVGIFIGTIQTWIKNGKQESLDDIVLILENQAKVIENTGFFF